MADDERIYTIPLRVARTVPRTQRAERAVTAIRAFARRHMKAEADKVWIDNPVNELVWSRSMQKPPPKIRVKMIKFEDGVVEVSLPEEGSETGGSKRKKTDEKSAETAESTKSKGSKKSKAQKTEEPSAEAEKPKAEA